MTVALDHPRFRPAGREEHIVCRCELCHVSFEVRARTVADRIAKGNPNICGGCRAAPTVCVTESARSYWRSRFTSEQLVALAEGVWGPREEWPERVDAVAA